MERDESGAHSASQWQRYEFVGGVVSVGGARVWPPIRRETSSRRRSRPGVRAGGMPRRCCQAASFKILNGPVGISCASTSACVAVDSRGDIASSRDPAAGASSWRVVHDASGTGVSRISCVSRSVCVAIGPQGVLWSKNPTARRPRWVRTDFASPLLWRSGGDLLPVVIPVRGRERSQSGVHGEADGELIGLEACPYHFSQSLAAVSCPTLALCVAVDNAGGVVVSTAPAARRSSWRRFEIAWNTSLSAISCPSSRLCVAGGPGGLITSTHPTRGAAGVEAEPWSDTAMAFQASRAHRSHCASALNPSACSSSQQTRPAVVSAWNLYHPRGDDLRVRRQRGMPRRR